MESDDCDGTTIVQVGDIGSEERDTQSLSPGTGYSASRRDISFGSIDNLVSGDNGADRSNSRVGVRTRAGRNNNRNRIRTSTVSDIGTESTETKEPNVPVVKRSRKPPVDPTQINILLIVVFGLLANWRGSHWHKKSSDTEIAANALAEYLATLPKATTNKIRTALDPITLALIFLNLFAEPLRVERELLYAKKFQRTTGKPQTGGDGTDSRINKESQIQASVIADIGQPTIFDVDLTG